MKEYASDRISCIYATSSAATQSRQIFRRVILRDLPPQMVSLFIQKVRSIAPIKVPQVISYDVIHLDSAESPQRSIKLGYKYDNSRSLADILRVAATHQKAPPDLFLRRICKGVIEGLVVLEAINGGQYIHGHLSLENVVASVTGDTVLIADYAFGDVHSMARQLRFRKEHTTGYDMYPEAPVFTCHDANQLGSILAYAMAYVPNGTYSTELEQTVLYLRRITSLRSFRDLQKSVQRIFEYEHFHVNKLIPITATPDRTKRPLSGASMTRKALCSVDRAHTLRTVSSQHMQAQTAYANPSSIASCPRPQSHRIVSRNEKFEPVYRQAENLLEDSSLSGVLDVSNISLNDSFPAHNPAEAITQGIKQVTDKNNQAQNFLHDEIVVLMKELEEAMSSPQTFCQKLTSNVLLSTQAFEFALIQNMTELVEAIVASGVPLVGADKKTGLILSVIYNLPSGVEKYTPSQCGCIDSSSNTALTHAIRLNRRSFVRILARFESRIHGPQNLLPIDLARSLNNRDIVNMLILADDFQRNQSILLNSQASAIDTFNQYTVPSVASTLLLSATQPDPKETNECTPIKQRKRPTSCHPELLYRNTGSPLIAAVKNNDPTREILQLIPEHAGKREKNGATALYVALEMGMLKIAMLLAPYELMIRGRDGMFPLEYIMRKGMKQLALDLIDSARDALGELHWAKLKDCVSKEDLIRIERVCAMPLSARSTRDKGLTQLLRNSRQVSPSLVSQQVLRQSAHSSGLFSYQSSLGTSSNLIVSGPFAATDPDAVRQLSQLNMSHSTMLRDSELSLINSIKKKNIVEVKKHLHQARHKDSRGWTALMYAAFLSFNSSIPLLSEEYGMTVTETGITALMIAAEVGNVGGVRHLSAHEGKMLSKEGKTGLIAAIESGHYKCAEILAFEANVWCPGCDSSLIYAIKANKLPFAQLCIPLGCGARDAVGATALMYAIALGDTTLSKALVPHESGMKDDRGMTALMYCVQYNAYETALLLVDKELGMRNCNGQTALSMASELGNSRFVSMLQKLHVRPGHIVGE
ncbi:Protein 21.1 [Giardia lamblia P15]|uniref:Protein 21.1 n=1 Tax=Giardia intestinalis (strain P15) TaxID=658858 RepID=E1F7B0_GIAIA|nr:Protein 21.1 [Giardia lamblia P15]